MTLLSIDDAFCVNSDDARPPLLLVDYSQRTEFSRVKHTTIITLPLIIDFPNPLQKPGWPVQQYINEYDRKNGKKRDNSVNDAKTDH